MSRHLRLPSIMPRPSDGEIHIDFVDQTGRGRWSCQQKKKRRIHSKVSSDVKNSTATLSDHGMETQIITGSIRTGAQVYAKNKSLVVLGSINSGAEVGPRHNMSFNYKWKLGDGGWRYLCFWKIKRKSISWSQWSNIFSGTFIFLEREILRNEYCFRFMLKRMILNLLLSPTLLKHVMI